MQACGALPGDNPFKPYGMYATHFSYQMIDARAKECGLPVNVKLTPPAPNTCDGAFTRLMIFER